MTFREATDRFHKACQEHRKYGACDSEPQQVFNALLRRALKGKPVEIPRTAEGWELYSSMEGADVVACTLYHEAAPAVEMAKQASEIVQYIE
jgi:hypothetical protein